MPARDAHIACTAGRSRLPFAAPVTLRRSSREDCRHSHVAIPTSPLFCLVLLLIRGTSAGAAVSSVSAVPDAPGARNESLLSGRIADEQRGIRPGSGKGSDASEALSLGVGTGRGSATGAERERAVEASPQLDDALAVNPDSIVASVYSSRPQPSNEDDNQQSTAPGGRRELLERSRYHQHKYTPSVSFASLSSKRPADKAALYIVYLNSAPSILTYRGGIAGLRATATNTEADDDDNDNVDGDYEDGGSGGLGGNGGNGGISGQGIASIKSVGGDGWGKAKQAIQQGVAELASTAAAAAAAAAVAVNTDGSPRRRPNVQSAAVREFSQFLKDSHRRLISAADLPASRIVHSYRYLINAFSARLTAAEAEKLKKQPWVDRVERSQLVRAATTHTPDFLRLPTKVWPQLSGESRAGEDVIIGLIDSGIWPEHPAFSDKTSTPYGAPPSRWRGRCNTTADFPRCSRKIIGAQWFVAGLKAEGGRIDPTIEYLSPRDANSHGSWCAGAAAGNAVRVKSGAQPLGTARGMAPRARVAVYKALWFDGRVAMGSEADVYKAVDRAVADGVDILSMSVAFSDENYFKHLPLMRAAQAGVLPILVAGNLKAPPDTDDGMYRTIRNASPYYLTVAASTTDRAWPPQATLRLLDGTAGAAGSRSSGGWSRSKGGAAAALTSTGLSGDPADSSMAGEAAAAGVTVVGVTYHAGTARTVNLSLVDAGAAGATNASRMQARMCIPGSLDRSLVAGRIVLCEAGGTSPDAKAGEVRRAGGRAIVIATASATAGSGDGYALDLPSLVVNQSTSQALRRFLNKSSNPRATLSSLYLPSNQVAPAMAPFSSTGPIVDPSVPASQSPDAFINDILKPDITGPGVNLLGPMASGKSGEAAYQLLSGTSMAVPHLAGIAALIIQKYPFWSPAAVKSAIMTTATTWNNKDEPIKTASGQRATPWNFGSGHVIPARVLDPGLVYNVGAKGYMAFLFGINAGSAQKLFSQQQPLKGGRGASIKAYNLNLPNICVSNLVKHVTVVRQVTNVASQASRYRARVVAPKNVRVTVTPAAFTIAPGASQTFSVTFTVVQATRTFSFGSLTWVDGTHRVRSVLAAQPIQA
ncbi:hypothetical protein CLOM_g19743 [Closterium sp. NIES-68]|nr:hypothetical protein CLOM_g19743 [Closterium sp. NIES-68]GJP83802.1 hypothetical protein CLOP_g13907 [Closterium sp. NIES-67]